MTRQIGAPWASQADLDQVKSDMAAMATPEFRVAGGWLQERIPPQTAWTPIVDLASLATPGVDGKSVELQKTATAIQWRQAGGSWADLVLLSALKGDTGASGAALVGTATITQTALIAISAGVRTVDVPVTGVVTGANYILFPTAAMPAGYALHDVVCVANGTLKVGVTGPLLAIGASYSIGVRVVRINT